MALARLKLESTALLVVDMQEKLLPHIHEWARMTDQVARLMDGVNALELPVLVTEQYRKGLGPTVEPIAGRFRNPACLTEKLKFSACVDEVQNVLSERQLRSVVVCGIEAHVCVLQTCLDLAHLGYVPFVAVDAIGSRRPADRDAAVERLIQAGVVPTTVESALLELVHEAGTERFKAVLPVIK